MGLAATASATVIIPKLRATKAGIEMLRLKEFLEQVKDLPEETPLCVAEVEEAFAAHIGQVDVVKQARSGRSDADPTEAVELSGGSDSVIVLRW